MNFFVMSHSVGVLAPYHQRKLLNTVLERKKRWIEHLLRLEKEVIEGRMEGKKNAAYHVAG